MVMAAEAEDPHGCKLLEAGSRNLISRVLCEIVATMETQKLGK